eukprot:TRINITY_DN4506_c0_g1_i1.p1 TRINITY_DN4506_c0_g1~~TRINITY_DN4506_c0_g1_i1.p1  ORF type:complete len:485 (+),score=91.49 TRINITY_DN4506_c0_g1_i1:1601-3055(+)
MRRGGGLARRLVVSGSLRRGFRSVTRTQTRVKASSVGLNVLRSSTYGRLQPRSGFYNPRYSAPKRSGISVQQRWYSDESADDIYEKPHMNICTIGHVDHGKTTLTSAVTHYLSGKDPTSKIVSFEEIDKAPEEKRRGITINTAHVEYKTPKRHYAHIDNPGHKEFVKNMITGTSLTDAAILVVDASIGPMPQTREHVLLTRQVGVENIVIWLNKVELVEDRDLVEMVEMELRELLTEYGYDGDNALCVHGSALMAMEGKDEDGLGTSAIQKLLDSIDSLPDPKRPVEKPFYMAIEDLHVAEGRGAVATGVVSQGKINVGDAVDIVGFKLDPRPIKATVTAIETFHKSINSCRAGDSVGMLLRGPTREDLRRGMVLSKPKILTPYKKFKTKIYITTKDEGGRTKGFGAGYAPQLYFGTGTVTGHILMGEDDFVNPGDTVDMEFDLIWPCVIYEGMKFSCREGGMTVGAGVVTEILDKEEAGGKKK